MTASEPVDASIVLGFKSRYLDAEIPNRLVADYVRQHPDRLIGFAGIDPTDPSEAVKEMQIARDEFGMRGVALSPAAQDFHPCHTNAKTCYEAAGGLRLPVLFHNGVRNAPECVLQYGQPALLDEVAREFPSLKIIVAHMGYPWVHETVALIAKQQNVYSDISWLLHRPWSAYQSLLVAYEHGVMHKLLFGSGFPYTNAAHCIEALYGINHLVHGTNLPAIPREHLRGIVQRDALELLGIRPQSGPRNGSPEKPLIDYDDD
ncbi:MAG: amidohydrolase family protein [Phycisphaerae bacterium]